MKVELYTSPHGRTPVQEYLDSVDKKLRSKTIRSIALLECFGNRIGEPDAKHLGKGIFELRTTMGNNAGRVLFFFFDQGRAVLTHGFVKKTQKTPRREIERAKRYREEYIGRMSEGLRGAE